MEEIKTAPRYGEAYRPQFHFTAQENWLNDPNGMVCYQGEYHLFFQHNPHGREWGNMTWGHAVSTDLTHWEQLPDALTPDAMGTMFSGSAVVDWDNTTGSQNGPEPPLIALYTAAGGTSPESEGKPSVQCLAYSNDRGRSWTKYAGNPILPSLASGNRDPKIVWYAQASKWIMALYLDGSDFALFASPDLKAWTHLQTLTLPGCDECPDFFEMPIEGTSARKWVFTAANGKYLVGDFDGRTFTPETPVLPSDYGANFYAVQTFSDTPDNRRIQIAWMRGGEYPGMPFNQQMSFPCTLTLHQTPDGPRLHRWPVKEIANLHMGGAKTWHDVTVSPGDNPLGALSGDLWDVEAEFEMGSATAFGLRLRGEDVRVDMEAQTVACLGRAAPLPLHNNRVKLRVLVDRTSLEVFAGDGQISLTSCFLPRPDEETLEVFAEGGMVQLVSLTAHWLRSAWPDK